MRLPAAETALLQQVFHGLDNIQIARLLKAGEWRNLEAGTILTDENQPVEELFFLISGRAGVLVGDTLITHLNAGAFIGEIAFLTGQTATATVVVDQPARLLVFKKKTLNKIFAQDEQLSLRIHRLIGSDLAGKLRIVNGLHPC
jgi:CRP-like cAMP-binding protein